jgi:hypothetical protein
MRALFVGGSSGIGLAGALPTGRVGAPDDVADAVWHCSRTGS